MKIVLVILALTIPAFAQRSDLGMNITYDRFKDESVVKLTESLMPDRNGYVLFSLVAVFKGKDTEGVQPKTVAIVIQSHTEEWYFLKTNNILRVIQDDERYEIGKMEIADSDATQRGVVEVLVCDVPLATIEKLSRASKLEIQVGRYEAEIKPSAIANIQRYVKWFSKK